ncbi:prolyl oligopeptidase family serine peptidase [Brytella acorum]|uniref:Prolyl oligopeptidase family serine peptidase n=1 Tax=Brytella acorum TaxID=2959299 RepID=A0AA35XX75_9PROT|nr:prolyl oligopeptidase family serine peptidase [Brytella acorum]MDF3623532.1 prolyl oligopeptidase family serine peptidase [Brytella acorum]CAI9121617.1 prolyl oligopeptidase family serine peptidase [Brytella acorum]
MTIRKPLFFMSAANRSGLFPDRMVAWLLTAATALAPASGLAAAPLMAPEFLTEVNGKQALDWVHTRDDRTLAAFRKNPLFGEFQKASLDILQSTDRIPMPSQHGAFVYNFWRDASHIRGIWRRTDVASYRTASPKWTVVLDLDALAAREKRNWFLGSTTCQEPGGTRCLIGLSEGGEDAETYREFDLETRQFVKGGFFLPHAKQDVSWLDADTLLVSRPWTPDEVTTSSYPYIVKKLGRGQKLEDATQVFAGVKSDMSVGGAVLHDSDGHVLPMIVKLPTFFTRQVYRLDGDRAVKLDLPEKSDSAGYVHGRLIVRLNQEWRGFVAGSVVAVDPMKADLAPELVVAPTARQTIEGVGVSRDRLVISLYDNVRGQAWIYRIDDRGHWNGQRLTLPENVSVSVVDSDLETDTAFISVTGFLTPTTLWMVDTATGAAAAIKHAPAQFDTTGLIVEQHEAPSTDGTLIPYFVVRRKDAPLNGKNPTLLYAYGGFQASMTPYYSGVLGKLWFERGGVYVLANIRGGGEFGPAWHDAGLKTKRQIVFDDFAAVGKDIVACRITSPDYLAIKGGSNGGLLMGVEFTQHPDMWKAAIIQVPLLDMLNYETMSAGASWVDEYGSNAIPAEHAFLTKVSPVQNLRAGVRYPVPLITTTTKDDRVGPVHARRFAARMEALHLPYYYFEETEGGHSNGANFAEIAQEQALEYTYLWQILGAAGVR